MARSYLGNSIPTSTLVEYSPFASKTGLLLVGLSELMRKWVVGGCVDEYTRKRGRCIDEYRKRYRGYTTKMECLVDASMGKSVVSRHFIVYASVPQ